jgi:Coenzyme PQQ synthesis protein D (PqqD)
VKESGNALNSQPQAPIFPADDLVPIRRDDVSDVSDGSELRLRRQKSSNALGLNDTGRAIWALCDGETSVAGICEALRQDFDVDGLALRRDVATLLCELLRRGFLSFREVPHDTMGIVTLDLRQIPVYVINCKSDLRRRDRISRHLRQLGLRFEFIEATECKPSFVGATLSYLRVLKREDIATPFLLLEDDCQFNEDFRYEHAVPRETDALYLGVSLFGTEVPGQLSWGKPRAVLWSHYGAEHLRVYNMLATHAIIYLSKGFRRSVIEANIDALTHGECPYPGDVGTASTHLTHLVLTPLKPVCRQQADVGGNQVATERALTDL